MDKNKKIREFPVDLSKEMVHEAIGLSLEDTKKLSFKVKDYFSKIISHEVENLAEIAQEIGETFTIKELVLNSLVLLIDKIHHSKNPNSFYEEDEDDEDDDDDELDIRSVL